MTVLERFRTAGFELVCPDCHSALAERETTLSCAFGHGFPVLDGIPILLSTQDTPNHRRHWEQTLAAVRSGASTAEEASDGEIDPYVRKSLTETHGLMYRGVAERLSSYPIPEIRLPDGRGKTLVDIGCNWGRWVIAAAERGYRVVGLDPSIDAVRAGVRVARQLGKQVEFLVGDARHLPFQDGTIDVVHSYSVLQHFAWKDVLAALRECHRVLSESGFSKVEMLNAFGARCLWNQARRGFRPAQDFEVRYHTPRELLVGFWETIGPSRLEVDGFFSANAQRTDLGVLPARYRAVVVVSEALRTLSSAVKPLRYFADSVFVVSTKESPRGPAPKTAALAAP